MNRSKFYKYAAIGLLLLNVTLIAAFFITKPKGRPGDNNRLNIEEHFKMDKAQHDLFLKNLELHIEQSNEIRKKQLKILKPYLYSVGEIQLAEERTVFVDLMKDLEAKKLESMYEHLNGLKSILNEDQMPLFDLFLKRRLEEMTNKNKKMPRNRG